MSHAGDVVISVWMEEDLSLVFETTKYLRVDDSIPVAFERSSELVWLLWPLAPSALV
jgi:hypothetical protein